MLLEPRALADGLRQRTRAGTLEASPEGVRVAVSSQRLQAALVAAGLASCVAGLLGSDAGLLWIVAGVWTVRAVWGSPPGFAWGVVCLGAGARWGTLSAADVEVTARIFGPSVAAGPIVVRAAMSVALAAALVSESRIDGLRAKSWAERSAALLALLALVGLLCAPGPGHPQLGRSLVWWAAAGVAVVAATLAMSARSKRIPAWLPPVVAGSCVVGAAVLS